jgi:hypothetical protein
MFKIFHTSLETYTILSSSGTYTKTVYDTNMPSIITQELPLYKTLGHIAALWIVASLGYYIIFPIVGLNLSYNKEPILIALYYVIWAAISLYVFWDIFYKWVFLEKRWWVYALECIGYGGLLWALLYGLSVLPIPQGPTIAEYTDILFASPWYFLPKAADVLLQQVLITTLIVAIAEHTKSLNTIIFSYALSFGVPHVLLFMLGGAPTPYATVLTIGAVLSAFVFPWFILRVKSGFTYSYMIHLTFYILAALVLHAWPPPNYF